MGGYAKSGTGGSTNITIVNNSLYDNDTQNTGSGEFQIQYRATGIVFENNIVYAGTQGLFIHGFTSGSAVTANYNDYYTTSSTTTFELNNKTYTSFASYRSATGQDKNSVFANPDYITATHLHVDRRERATDADHHLLPDAEFRHLDQFPDREHGQRQSGFGRFRYGGLQRQSASQCQRTNQHGAYEQ